MCQLCCVHTCHTTPPPTHATQVGDVGELDPSEWQVPPHCIPIHANVTTFDWSRLYGVTSFDVIMMDPPWQLATANPTRGVALGYSQLTGVCVCGC
jgi:mRNA (2'-O-methyladenosine-N6-)-methyltransferase